MQDYYTVDEAAAKLRANRSSIYRWMNAGKLQYNKTATGKTLIPESALLAFIGEKPKVDGKEPVAK